jgi:hypothetical protein
MTSTFPETKAKAMGNACESNDAAAMVLFVGC